MLIISTPSHHACESDGAFFLLLVHVKRSKTLNTDKEEEKPLAAIDLFSLEIEYEYGTSQAIYVYNRHEIRMRTYEIFL